MAHRIFAALLVSAALAACAHQNAAQAPIAAAAEAASPGAVKLYALDCGRISVSDADAFADSGVFKGVSRDFVDPCYLIRHPNGDLMWDTGLPEAIAAAPGPVVNGIFTLSVPKTIGQQLAELGLTVADIEFVSVSHSHFDHVGNGGLFAAASTFLVDPLERAHMFRAEARADTQVFPAYAALETAETIEIPSAASFDVFGDGSVMIHPAPGHTPGHRILLVRLANAGPLLLTGDMFHLAESREKKTVPRFNTNRDDTLASIETVERIAKETGAKVIRQHVTEDFTALPAFPQALD